MGHIQLEVILQRGSLYSSSQNSLVNFLLTRLNLKPEDLAAYWCHPQGSCVEAETRQWRKESGSGGAKRSHRGQGSEHTSLLSSESWLDIIEASQLWVGNPILVHFGGLLFWITYRATSVVLTRCPLAVTSGSKWCPVGVRGESSTASLDLLLRAGWHTTCKCFFPQLRGPSPGNHEPSPSSPMVVLHVHLKHKVSSTSPFWQSLINLLVDLDPLRWVVIHLCKGQIGVSHECMGVSIG